MIDLMAVWVIEVITNKIQDELSAVQRQPEPAGLHPSPQGKALFGTRGVLEQIVVVAHRSTDVQSAAPDVRDFRNQSFGLVGRNRTNFSTGQPTGQRERSAPSEEPVEERRPAGAVPCSGSA